MWIHPGSHPRRTLKGGVAVVASVAALLGLGVDPALASYKAEVRAGTLQIAGNDASDKLALRLSPGDPNTLTLDVGDDGTTDFSFDRSTFTAINVQAGGGNDEVRVDNTFGDFTEDATTIDGGSGNDRLIGGDGNDLLIGGTGNDVVDGGRGNDVALLGAGNDTFIWNPGDSSDTVEGQGGDDVLDFNGSNASEHIDVSANGSRVRLTRDVAEVTMDLSGIEGLALNALGGTDTITVNDLTGTDLKQANIDLSGFPGSNAGDEQPDTVIVNGTPKPDNVHFSADSGNVLVSGLAAQVQVAGSDPTDDTLQLNTLAGNDTVSNGIGVSGPSAIAIDGGEGSDTVTYSGTESADTIGIAPNGTAVSTFTAGTGTSLQNTTGVESLDVRGLGGADTIDAQNGLASLTSLTIDGGSGNDTLIGGDGNDLLIGDTGNDVVDGGRGNDVALLGPGGDTFIWNPGDSSDSVEGQGGNDVLDFNGSNIGEHIDVSANGSRVRLTRDVAAVTLDFNGVEGLAVNALGGEDTITVNDLTGTDLKHANIDLSGIPGSNAGDEQPDTVIVNGTPKPDNVHLSADSGNVLVSGLATQVQVAGSDPTKDTLQLNTLAGNDTVAVARDVNQLINPVIDLGADQ